METNLMEHGPQLAFSEELHREKYRGKNESFKEAMNRVASGLTDDPEHFKIFRQMLLEMRFMPAGRIQSAIGSTKNVTPYNCFVSGTIEDSFVHGNNSIMAMATQAAATMRMGGGIGYDFSTLRPRGDYIHKLQSQSSGAVSFMHIFNAVCSCVASSGHRRGAQMGVLRIDHPDIEEFIHAKQPDKSAEPIMRELENAEPGSTEWSQWYTALQAVLQLTGFNTSIAVTDKFMECLETGDLFELKFGNKVYREIEAEVLWETVMRSTWDWAEPGTLFIDRMNEMNNLAYCETIAATNPCFTGDTKVWTEEHGLVQFCEVLGEEVNVLTQLEDGELVYRPMTNIRVTQRDAKLVEVILLDGTVIHCTPEHEFFVDCGIQIEPPTEIPSPPENRTCPKRRLRKVKAINLSSRDSICGAVNCGNTNRKLRIRRHSHRIHSVKHIDVKEDVYCGTVASTGKFFVYSGDNSGVLVSNCAEQSLPPHGACLLGSFNLTRYLCQRSDGTYYFNYEQFTQDIPIVVRAMDNVVDAATYPLYEQEKEAKSKRRMGLGITGLANAIEALGYPYGSKEFLVVEGDILDTLAQETYRASALLAKGKGAFPLFNKKAYLQSKYIQQVIEEEIIELIAKHGIRNSHLTSIAPTGTISMCADNVSSGIEPVFSYGQKRTVNMPSGQIETDFEDYGVRVLGVKGKRCEEVTAAEHLAVLDQAQQFIDSSISKTCNVSPDMPWEDFKELYHQNWASNGKGLTTFTSGGKRQGILKSTDDDKPKACYVDPSTGLKECE